jgi:hypothetical protein
VVQTGLPSGEDGLSFWITVNSVRIFARGASFVPSEGLRNIHELAWRDLQTWFRAKVGWGTLYRIHMRPTLLLYVALFFFFFFFFFCFHRLLALLPPSSGQSGLGRPLCSSGPGGVASNNKSGSAANVFFFMK